jgi:CelD/BcsL family acetyltransferase involved in cellulose biosynthesis
VTRRLAGAVELIADLPALAALVPEWLELWERAPDATPFQRPEWLLPWWRQFAGDALLVLALRRDGRLAALLPLYLRHEPPLRKLLPLGAGTTDYLDLLAAPGCDAEALQPLLDRLAGERARWDLLDLQNLPAGARLLALAAPEGWQDERIVEATCPVLPLDADPIALRRRLPWRHLRNGANRAGRLGALTYHSPAEDELPGFLAELCCLHGARWAGRGEPGGVLADPAVRAWHAEALPVLARAGLLRCHMMALDGRVVAAFYGLCAKGRLYAYIMGFDDSFERQSFGSLLLAHAIFSAAAEGARELHFLRGGEGYKYMWGAADRPLTTRKLRPPLPLPLAGEDRGEGRAAGSALTLPSLTRRAPPSAAGAGEGS